MIAPLRPRDSSHDEDAHLMEEVRHGRHAAFAELYRRHRGWVEGVLVSAGAERDPRDLAQEVFLRVFRARHSYRPEAKFSTWLFTIVTNVAKNSRRTKARKRARCAVDNHADPSLCLGDMLVDHRAVPPLLSLLNAERSDLVQRSISLLSDREQDALRSYHFEGLSCAQIAENMHCTTSAVKSLLLRARAKVRTRLRACAGDVPA